MKKFLLSTIAVLSFMSVNGYAQEQLPGTKNLPFVYSVKFLCGLQTVPSGGPNQPPPLEPPVKPGNYATAVNIHNYHTRDTAMFVKVVVANGEIGQITGIGVKPNQALSIDCTRIAKQLTPPLPSFIEGFVEIASQVQLSVAAAYTSQTCRNPGDGRCTALGELDLEVVPQHAFRDQ